MNVLIIGSGGREAAIARELNFSKKIKSLYMIPENKALNEKVRIQSATISLKDHSKILDFVKEKNIQLVVVGPEQPLVDGLSDFLRENKINVFGPSQKGAMLEGSKIFCKEFLEKAKIPTGSYLEVQSLDDLMDKSKKFQKPYIAKADGLASGKGVYICQTDDELRQAGQELFIDKKLGEQKVFLEEYISGQELSYLAVTNGVLAEALPLAQDHKRIFDGDKGPNTGGMGAVAPLKIPKDLDQKIKEKIVEPMLKQLQKEKIDYRGVIYFGIMVKDGNPYVLEINCRFGDPETQVILPLLDGDWADVFHDISEGVVKKLKWKRMFAACIAMAAPGYPDTPEKGLFIDGNIFAEAQGAYYICAGVDKNAHGQWITNGGRVLNAVAVTESAKKSLELSYGQSEKVKWRGVQKRSDIGKKVLKTDEFVFN